MDNIEKFCSIIRRRSAEHKDAMDRLKELPGMMVSVLRQELDSMIRAIYLLSINDIQERQRLIKQTLNGERWTTESANGKTRTITDRDMVEISNQLFGWTKSVYDFGCAFIHLSNLHGYAETDPLAQLSEEEKTNVLRHLRNYHDGPTTDNPSINELSEYFPKVLEKISGNLDCYLRDIELDQAVQDF